MSDQKISKQSNKNPLQIGTCILGTLEEKLKAFRIMNQNSIKKRYFLSRDIIKDPTGKILLNKSSEIDIPTVKLLRRYYSSDQLLKVFQPDEGIAIISDMTHPIGISLTMDIVTQIMNIGGGTYEGFIERVDSFMDFLKLLKKVLFPKILIIGFIPEERLYTEKINFMRYQKVDPYISTVEITHSVYKKTPYFSKLSHIHIDAEDAHAWSRLVIEIINLYTKPYLVEEIDR